MKLNQKSVFTVLLIIGSVIIFTVVSQTFSGSDQIFITDTIFITPKTQPTLFILLMFVNIVLIVFAIYLGLKIAGFLYRKGIIFQVVGTFLLIMTGILSYVSLYLGRNIKTTKEFIIMLIMILFVGSIGVLMVFNSFIKINRKK